MLEILSRAAAAARFTGLDTTDCTSDDTDDVHDHQRSGFFFAITDSVPGAPLPRPQQTWLAFAPMERSVLAPTWSVAQRNAVLRRRMQLVEVIARLSMTRRYDWQSHVDWPEALQALNDPTALQQPQAAAALRWESAPRFLISLMDSFVTNTTVDMLEQLLSGVAHNNAGEWRQDHAFRELLLADEKDHDPKTSPPRHHVVELGLAIHCGHFTAPLLDRLLDVLEHFQETQHTRHTNAVARGAAVSIEFRVTTLRFDSVSDMVSSAVAQLGERAPELLYLTALRLSLPWRIEPRSLQQGLTNAVRPRVAGHAPLQSLSVENAVSSFATLGATLRYQTDVRALTAVYTADDMHAFAAWLAFGLFHVDSDSTVTTLQLRMPGPPANVEDRPPYGVFSPAWIAVFKLALQHVAASEELGPITISTSKHSQRKRTREDHIDTTVTSAPASASPLDELELPHDRRVVVTVKAKTRVFAQPSNRSELVAIVGDPRHNDLAQRTHFHVIRKLRAWLALAVPGVGAGWIPTHAVEHEDAVPTRLTATSEAPMVNTRVTSLAWMGGSYPADDELRGPHADTLMELLAVIGAPLRSLHLSWMALRNQHVAAILRSCPNLEELNLSNNEITDLAPLVAAYESGACTITSLNVGQYGEFNDAILRQVATVLALPSCPLQRLVVRITRSTDAATLRFFRDAIRLHFHTKQLEYVRIHCDELDEDDDYERLAHENEPTGPLSSRVQVLFRDVLATPSYCRRSLPLRSKLAVLSVVKLAAEQQHPSSRPWGALDTGVLAGIFELAGTSHVRVLDIWDR